MSSASHPNIQTNGAARVLVRCCTRRPTLWRNTSTRWVPHRRSQADGVLCLFHHAKNWRIRTVQMGSNRFKSFVFVYYVFFRFSYGFCCLMSGVKLMLLNSWISFMHWLLLLFMCFFPYPYALNSKRQKCRLAGYVFCPFQQHTVNQCKLHI